MDTKNLQKNAQIFGRQAETSRSSTMMFQDSEIKQEFVQGICNSFSSFFFDILAKITTTLEPAQQKMFHILKFATVRAVEESVGLHLTLLTLSEATLILIWLKVFQVDHSR